MNSSPDTFVMDSVAPVEPPVPVEIKDFKRKSFSQWYFPARDRKPPIPKSIEVVNDKGETETLSLTEFKKARRVLFTVRRDTVVFCGHKIDMQNGPKNNCLHCWFAWFNNHAGLVESLDEGFMEHGPDIIDLTRGIKTRKFFLKFKVAVAYSKREEALRTHDGQLTEDNVESITGISGSSAEAGQTGSAESA